MSGRVRKQSDCPVGKQGPMRATLPVSSVMKSGGLKKSTANSPTLSPTNVWRRISPDHALSGSRFGTGGVPLRAARSSVEGLNQEIERLVLYPASGTQTPHLDRLKDKVTPEGHRAPLAELLRRSVNTQTPHDLCHTAHSSGGSVCSSPDLDGAKLGTSPQINRFLAREPPDGCEKVNLKGCEGAYTESVSMMKPAVPGFTLRPSLGSAFQPLQPASPSPPSPTPH
ncbi:hypothetical protein MSG28_010273 [Choristoneura fumiferana]|uniref:Uncharacterized protein n=1 Tax=Choristoneura fumiferana TaxID=7141 RepID=A0ACC0KKK9_CHOFU|nr:hypothetical protein MSG28_010273 [Choristoneura fumiferana]